MVTQLSQLSHPRIHAGLHERATTPLCTETPCLGLLWIPLGEEQRDWPSEPAQWPAILYAGWSLPGYHWEPSEKGTTKKQYNYSFWFTYIPILDWVPPSVYAVGYQLFEYIHGYQMNCSLTMRCKTINMYFGIPLSKAAGEIAWHKLTICTFSIVTIC